MCQHCLANSLPFQSLDDIEYQFTVSKGINISEEEMDRLMHLKFNPFDTSNNIALSENNANLDKSSKINCEYYLPNDFKKRINNENLNNFSMMHLNIRSVTNKFDSFKQLIYSLNKPFQYYEEQLINYKHDTKVLWKTLNEIMNRNKTNRMLPKEFNGNSPGERITDPNTIANRFNDYFVNIGPGLAKKLPNSKTTFDKYLTNSCKNSFFINPITKYELENEINNLNAKKSPGYDGISSQVIKAIATEISEPLSHIFNLSFLSGTIPDDLKIALVTPIFKANENNEFKNYRPISVLTCFSKLLEKLMYKRLINHIEKNNILTQHQYDFRENRSTELAIIELVDRITKAIDKGE